MKFQNMMTGEEVEALPWQMALKPGDCYVNESPIAGIITVDGATEQFKDLPKIYCQVLSEARDVGPGFLWVRAYSEFEPGGERGLNCIVDGTRPITREEFDQAVKELQK
jgi:hypothetical protein